MTNSIGMTKMSFSLVDVNVMHSTIPDGIVHEITSSINDQFDQTIE